MRIQRKSEIPEKKNRILGLKKEKEILSKEKRGET